MRKMNVVDMTLAETNKMSDVKLSFKEKIEVARHLDALCVDKICLAPLKNERTDTLLVRTISSFANNSVIELAVGINPTSVDVAWNAVMQAKKPALRVELPVSPIQMEYMYRMKAPKLLETVKTMVEKCASVCKEVSFWALDATRAEEDVLASAIQAAIEAGATEIMLCDNSATMMPDAFGAYIENLYAQIPALKGVTLGVMCDNKLGLALASGIMAVKAGANAICISAAESHYAKLTDLAQVLHECGDTLGVTSDLKFTQANRLIRQIEWIVNAKQGEKSPFDSETNSEPSALEFSINDDITAISEGVKKLGYDLSEEDLAKVYEAFKRVAAKKTVVTAKELDAIVANDALQVPPTYKLISYVINNGNVLTASANIVLEKDGSQLQGISLGDGPIDAAFVAIEKIVGHHYELDDFQIQSVTEGREAMGAAVVKLRNNGKLYSGRGISTDIIGSSIRAYLNALNKIIYEEE